MAKARETMNAAGKTHRVDEIAAAIDHKDLKGLKSAIVGADLDEKVKGTSLIAKAIDNDFYKGATLLAESGADVREAGLLGRLFLRIDRSDPSEKVEKEVRELTGTLIGKGASLHEKDADDATPIEHLISNRYPNKEFLAEMTKELSEKGAKTSVETLRIAKRNHIGMSFAKAAGRAQKQVRSPQLSA